jgi:hypothetical protein
VSSRPRAALAGWALSALVAAAGSIVPAGATAQQVAFSGPVGWREVDDTVAWNASRLGDDADSIPESMLVEVYFGRVTSRTMEVYRIGTQILIPIREFLDQSELRWESKPNGDLEFYLQPGNIRTLVSPTSDTILVGNRKVAIRRASRLQRGDDDFLSLRVIRDVMGVDFLVDYSDLQIYIRNPEVLPIGQRAMRDRQLQSFRAQAAENAAEGPVIGLDRRRIGGAVLDYSFLLPSSGFGAAGSWRFGLGADVLGGSLEAQVYSYSSPSLGDTRFNGSWTGVWRQNRYVTQLRLGDAFAGGPYTRNVVGFSITNSPYVRPDFIGQMPFRGQLGDGWEVQAYRNGQMVAFDSVGVQGEFSVNVPIQYGENPLDFVAYGPHGEIRKFSQTYRVLGNALPYKTFEYSASGGACRYMSCDANASLNLKYAFAPRWVAQAGMDEFWRSSDPDLFHPYLGLSGNPTNAFLVTLAATANASLIGGVDFEPSTALRATTVYSLYDQNVKNPILTPTAQKSDWLTTAMLRPIPNSWAVTLDGSLDISQTVFGSNANTRVGGSWQAAEVRLNPFVNVQRSTSSIGPVYQQTFLGLDTYVMPLPGLGRFLGGVMARGSYLMNAQGQALNLSAFFSRQVVRGLRAEIGGTWYRGNGTTFSLTLTTNLHSVRSYTSVIAQPGGEVRGTEYVEGSVVYSPEARNFAFATGPSLQRAGVRGVVYLDANGDGKRQPDEPALGGVTVQVGMNTTVTDSLGRFKVWDMYAYEPVHVAVDSASLASPLWVPASSVITVEPAPNGFSFVNLPVVPAGVVEGSVLRQSVSGPVPVSGASVVIVERVHGTKLVTTTFSDGTFYVLGVKPGDYQVMVSDGTQRKLRLAADPIPFNVKVDPNGDSVSGLNLLLH